MFHPHRVRMVHDGEGVCMRVFLDAECLVGALLSPALHPFVSLLLLVGRAGGVQLWMSGSQLSILLGAVSQYEMVRTRFFAMAKGMHVAMEGDAALADALAQNSSDAQCACMRRSAHAHGAIAIAVPRCAGKTGVMPFVTNGSTHDKGTNPSFCATDGFVPCVTADEVFALLEHVHRTTYVLIRF